MKYCLKCGKIYAESYDEYENETCWGCGSQLIEDNDMTEEQFLKLSESEKDKYELKIYNICKQSEFFKQEEYDENHEDLANNWNITFRFDKFEQMTGEKAWTKENEFYHDMKAREEIAEAMASYAGRTNNRNTVTCPFCKSANVRKIGGGERAVSVLGLGLLSKKINKSFECKSCGGTF